MTSPARAALSVIWRHFDGPTSQSAREALAHAFAYIPLHQQLPNGNEVVRYFGDKAFWRFVEEVDIHRVYEPCPELVPQPDEIIMDVGAHIGLYSLRASRLVGPSGRVIAVEPDSKQYRLLERNTRSVPGGRVLCFSVALWDHECELTLFRSTTNFGAASAVLERDGGPIRAPAVTLDSLVRKLDLKVVSLVKIDVEGAAPAVIRGGVQVFQRWHPKIVCAAYHTPIEEEAVTNLLTPLGYRVKPYDIRLPFASGPERYLYALPA